MVAEAPMRGYVVELGSRENEQRRRVNLMASSPDEAAAICEAKEAVLAGYRLSGDRLAEALQVARFVHRDSDIGGRFIRAGKTIRTGLPVPAKPVVNAAAIKAAGGHRAVLLDRGVGNTGSASLRAGLAAHMQEKPYRIDRVGSTDMTNVVTAGLYGPPWLGQIDGSGTPIVWASDTIRMSLHTSSYAYAMDTDNDFADTTNEVTGTGYTADGPALGSKTSTYDTASDQIRLDSADVSLTSSTITARVAVIYKDTGTAGTSLLMAWIDFGANVSTTAGTFAVTADATGWIVFDIT